MNKIVLSLIVVMLLLVLGGAAFYFTASPPPRSIRLDLTGTAGIAVTGEYTVDGAKHPIDGVLPLSFNAKGTNFEYIVRMPEDGGEIRGDLFIDGESEGASAAQPPLVGVRGEYETTAFSKSEGFTVVRKGE